jgi:hypothetical protein
MEGFKQNIDGFYDVENQLPRYLRRLAEQQFEVGEHERNRIDSREALDIHCDQMREVFFEALGGLPERTELNPVCTGTLNRDGYVVEKIVFESRPGFHVASNLYLPENRDGLVPGVLFFCGHADIGKAAGLYQQACIDLACDGFAVLAVDPLGQGERHQFYDPETGEIPRRNIAEHTYIGHRCILAGENVARYFVWDAIRALDFFTSRPEIDPDRIGATGNSGGGLQTAYLMLADDRLAAAMPCCFITSKEEYMKTGQAQDAEQIIPGAIQRGPRYDDFLTAFAPRPVRIGAAQSDFLCIEGTHRSYERACEAYALYDASDAIDLVISDTTHGLTPTLREAMVNWFRVHLRDDDPDFETNNPEPETTDLLHCVTHGEVNAAYPDERHVVDFTRQRVRKQNPTSPDDVNGDYTTTIQNRVRERFNLDRSRARLFPRVIESEIESGLVWEKVFFRSEPNVMTTGIVARTEDPPNEPTVLLLDHGTDDLPDYRTDVATLARERGLVLVFDPRGVGGVRARDVNTPLANGGKYYDIHGTEYKLASDALMLGTSLVALRVFDVLRAGEYLEDRLGDITLGIVGAGRGAIHALYAAVADPTFQSILIEDVPAFHERATARETTVDPSLNVYDVVGKLDIPQLIPALADREVERTQFPDSGLP